MMRISDIMEKEIINIKNGKKLGFITDIDLDIENGKVSYFSITGSTGGFFSRGLDIDTVFWKDILRFRELRENTPIFCRRKTVRSFLLRLPFCRLVST